MHHQKSSAGSRFLCESLVDNLRQNIPDLQCTQAEGLCSLFQKDKVRFAFVYHQNPGEAVTVHCLGKYEELQKAAETSKLVVLQRKIQANNGGWSERFPCHFKIDNQENVADAARILTDVSYNQSLTSKIKAGHSRPRPLGMLPEEISISEKHAEGAGKQVLVNRYERSSKARTECIKIHGLFCIICNFNFEEGYGRAGKALIHVHHLKPLSTVTSGYKVDPKNDLCPICPNCHAMVHRKIPPYTIEEVKAMLKHMR